MSQLFPLSIMSEIHFFLYLFFLHQIRLSSETLSSGFSYAFKVPFQLNIFIESSNTLLLPPSKYFSVPPSLSRHSKLYKFHTRLVGKIVPKLQPLLKPKGHFNVDQRPCTGLYHEPSQYIPHPTTLFF